MSSGGLASILSMGGESLSNARAGVEVSGHNIANTNTPGFSRQRLNLATKEPVRYGNAIFGNGAELKSIDRVHDKYLESQLRQHTISNSEKESLNVGLERIQSVFNPDLTSTIRDRMNSFFNSLRELASYPEEPSVRTNVAESGTNLTLAMQASHRNVTSIQNDINDELYSEISGFNQRLEELAGLNQQITELRLGSSAPNDLVDRRDAVIKDLCSLMNVQISENEQGMCIRGPKGVLLVEGKYFGRMDLNRSTDYYRPQIMLKDFTKCSEVDVTDAVSSGKIGGLVKVRDVYAQGVRDNLNKIAVGFGEAFNNVHRSGYGGRNYEDLQGRDFFQWGDADGGDAAATIQVRAQMISDPFAISAAMSPRSPGDNVMANELIRLQNANIMDGGKSSVLGTYDQFIGQLGVHTLRAKEDFTASGIVMSQLQAQRESASGVSLDEEAANLLRYQQLFQASSRIITTADELMKTVLDLKR